MYQLGTNVQQMSLSGSFDCRIMAEIDAMYNLPWEIKKNCDVVI